MAHRRQKRVVVARVNVFLEGSRCMVVVVERKEGRGKEKTNTRPQILKEKISDLAHVLNERGITWYVYCSRGTDYLLLFLLHDNALLLLHDNTLLLLHRTTTTSNRVLLHLHYPSNRLLHLHNHGMSRIKFRKRGEVVAVRRKSKKRNSKDVEGQGLNVLVIHILRRSMNDSNNRGRGDLALEGGALMQLREVPVEPGGDSGQNTASVVDRY